MMVASLRCGLATSTGMNVTYADLSCGFDRLYIFFF